MKLVPHFSDYGKWFTGFTDRNGMYRNDEMQYEQWIEIWHKSKWLFGTSLRFPEVVKRWPAKRAIAKTLLGWHVDLEDALT